MQVQGPLRSLVAHIDSHRHTQHIHTRVAIPTHTDTHLAYLPNICTSHSHTVTLSRSTTYTLMHGTHTDRHTGTHHTQHSLTCTHSLSVERETEAQPLHKLTVSPIPVLSPFLGFHFGGKTPRTQKGGMSDHWGRAGQALGPCAQRSSQPLLALPGRILHGASVSAGPGALGCLLLGSPLPAVVRRTPSSSSADMVGSAVMWHWYPAPTTGSGYREGREGAGPAPEGPPLHPTSPPCAVPWREGQS